MDLFGRGFDSPRLHQFRRNGCPALVEGHQGIINFMPKHVVHMSDGEAAKGFASLLDCVRAGADGVIEHDARPVAVVCSAEAPRGRLLSESIALAEAHAKELGYEPTMDPDFAADLREIINSRKPRILR